MIKPKIAKSIFLLALSVMLFGCATMQQTTDTGIIIDSKFDDDIYEVVVRVADYNDYQNTNAEFYGNQYYSNGVIWQDGKGLVRGTVISIDPKIDTSSYGEIIILKTTDRKVQLIQSNDIASFYCLLDYEPVCSRESNYQASKCVDIWEFDYCRFIDVKKGE